jgi:hypothetical protein
MTERLADLVIGLQRLAENAVIRGDDLSYVQRQEVYDHVAWLDQQIAVLDKVRATFMEQRKKFVPVERERPALSQQDEPRMPRVVRPKEVQQS